MLTNSQNIPEQFSALVPVNSKERSFTRIGITSLGSAIQRHLKFEKASFHTPGHKGRELIKGQESVLQADLTELPGLDELSNPEGVLLDLEKRAAKLWGSAGSVISVNGASAGIIAAMLTLTSERKKFLVPRNAHRSVINAMVIGGIEPIWYEPVWDARWGTWGAVSPVAARQILSTCKASDVAGMLVVSPTYTGAVSDIASIADSCHFRDIPLLVDEAHGAHFLPDACAPSSAVTCGADLTVHSLHKTLCGLTQTGMIHIGESPVFKIDIDLLRAQLNLVQSSSPSYPLLLSIEQTIGLLETTGKNLLAHLPHLRGRLEDSLTECNRFEIFNSRFETDPLHIFIAAKGARAEDLYDFCVEHGVFPEAMLGRGVLFLMGIGTITEDVADLAKVLVDFHTHNPESGSLGDDQGVWHFTEIEQVISPRQAFMSPSQMVPVHEAVGRIAAECVAPCPPGIPVCVPGQRIHPEVMNLTSVKNLRVVREQLISE
jgi:arginine decarboxylase